VSALTSLGLEITAAVVTGALSFAAAPAAGVQIHWNPEEVDPWLAPPLAYAVVASVIVVVLGRIVLFVVGSGAGGTRRPLRVGCASGVAFIVFAGLQRIPESSVLLAIVGASVAGLAVYSGTGALFGSGGDDASAEAC
jgi:hypothetical protein